MARVKIECTCKACSQNFDHIKFKNTRAEADSYEEWAKENVQICPSCYRKNEEVEAKRLASEKVKLPSLSGTEKQIAYAEKLRAKIVSGANENDMKCCMLVINKDEKFMAKVKAISEKNGKDEEEVIKDAMRSYGITKLFVCLTETNAEKLLDVIA